MYQYTKSTVAMWLLGGGGTRKDESETSKHSMSSRGSKRRSTKGNHNNSMEDENQKHRRRSRRDNRFGKVEKEKQGNKNNTDHSMHLLDETVSGIEVTISRDDATMATPSPTESSFSGNGLILLKQQVVELSRTYRAQYNPVERSLTMPPPSGPKKFPSFQSRDHRIPLFQVEPEKPSMLFDDVLFLLRSYDVSEELTCVKEELSLMEQEISAISADRTDIAAIVEREGLDVPCAVTLPPQYLGENGTRRWDVHRQLLVVPGSKKATPSAAFRTQLQEERGLNFTVYLENHKAMESLMSKCGCKASFLSQFMGGSSVSEITEISPQSCRDGGAGATIQHMTLMNGGGNASSSFILTRDNAKSYHFDCLPERLRQRMEQAPAGSYPYADQLVYLSTGPFDSYYAEFRNGERWWGSAFREDQFEFMTICRDWDVHRVVLGPPTCLDGGRDQHYLASSWIVLSRDGKVAWKNIPVRLHNKLSNRLASESALVEASLGCAGAYFIRFLDGTEYNCCLVTFVYFGTHFHLPFFSLGTTDWQLPARTAQVCRALELKGQAILSISLHPDLPNDFIIRHR
jgi:hypothetical protein